VISVDGEILFDNETIASPYHGDLIFDDNSDIRFRGDENSFAVIWENLRHKSGANDLTFQAILYRNGTVLFQYDSLSDAEHWPLADIGLQYGDLTTEASLVNSDTATYITNYTTVTNWNGDWPTITVTGTNVVITYHESVENQAILLYPSSPVILSVNPASGSIAPGETNTVKVLADARSVSAGGSVVLENSARFDFLSEAPTASAAVHFTATNSVETAFPPITEMMKALMWGTPEVPNVSFAINPDGSRTISWPSAADGLSRTYAIWYTTSLTEEWIRLATVDNLTEYTDSALSSEPVVFYMVTVQ
jgi:hypothetical protein